MRHSQTAVLERNTVVTADFATEPHEVGWAGEGRWFVQVLRASEEAAIDLTTEISPDGLTWCPWSEEVHTAAGKGLVSWPVREFGGWLRLRGSVRGPDPSLQVRIYLVVKS